MLSLAACRRLYGTKEKLKMLRRIAAQLSLIHSSGLLHLHISPENVAVDKTSGRVLLLPPDRSCQNDAKMFCAPELSRGRAENRSDIYSLGMLMRELFRGDEPGLATEGREELEQIINKCLALRPGARYSCCEELAEQLYRLEKQLEA